MHDGLLGHCILARGEGTLPKGQGTQRWRRRRGRGTAGALVAPNRIIFEEEGRGADLSHPSARRSRGEGEAPPGTTGGASTDGDRVVVVRSDAGGTAAGRRPPAAASAAGFGEVGQIGAGVCGGPYGGGRRRGRPDDAAAAAETGGEGQRLRWSRLLVAFIGRYDVDELAPLPDQAGGGRLG